MSAIILMHHSLCSFVNDILMFQMSGLLKQSLYFYYIFILFFTFI